MSAPATERPSLPASPSRVDVEPIDAPSTLAARALAYHRWGKPDKVTQVAGQMMITWFEEAFPDDLVDEVRNNPEWQ